MFVMIQRLLAEGEVQGAVVGSGMAIVAWTGLALIRFGKRHLEMWVLTRRNGRNGGNGKAETPKNNVAQEIQVCQFHGGLSEQISHLTQMSADAKVELATVGTDVGWMREKMKDDDINFRALYKKIDAINER